MPTTPIYGLPYETLGDQQGATLHGGSPPGSPILAEAVESQIQRLDGDIAATITDIDTVRATAELVTVLDTITGSGVNTTEFGAIPQDYDHLEIRWSGDSDAANLFVSLNMRFNGDSTTDAYSSQRVAFGNDSGTFADGLAISNSAMFTAGRAGLVGENASDGVIWIPGYSTAGLRKRWTGLAHACRGASHTVCIAGGQWNTLTDAITAVRLWPSGQMWDSMNATLIGYRDVA